MNRRDLFGPGATPTVRVIAILLILGLAILAPVACKRGGDTTPTPTPDGESAADVVIEPRAQAPQPDAPRLAQMAVFPATDEPLALSGTQPVDGAEDAPAAAADARIVLGFNHPIVQLATLDGREKLPAPATIDPPIAGLGEWLDTSTWVFTPSEALAGGTLYTVTVDPQLQDRMGATLADQTSISFTTASPAVARTLPRSGDRFAGTTTPISVTFNQPMEAASTENAFSLEDPQGSPVEGAASLTADGLTLLFEPDEPLMHEAAYRIAIAPGASAATGGALMDQAFTATFNATPQAAMVRSMPVDGAGDVRLEDGALHLIFSAPMDTATVSVTLRPTFTGRSEWWSEQDTELSIVGNWIASTAYTATLHAGALSANGDPITGTETVRFTLAPQMPRHELVTSGPFGLYRAAEPPQMWLTAVNTDEVPVTVYDLPTESIIELAATQDVWSFEPRPEWAMRSWTVDTTNEVDSWRSMTLTLSATGGTLPPGAYMVDATAGDNRQTTVLVVSPLNLTLKATSDEALVWATDLETGLPAAGVPVTVYEWLDDQHILAEGTTDADGLLRVAIARDGDPWQPVVAVAWQQERIIGVVGRHWSGGIGAWEFGLPVNTWPARYASNLYTDRPVYRPGQVVHFRGIVRLDDDGLYSLPVAASTNLWLRVLDANYEAIHQTTASMSDLGTFNGSFDLPDAASLGGYRIEVAVDDREDAEGPPPFDGPEVYSFSTSFTVAAYRKPAFEVELSTEHDSYRADDSIQASLEALYFFGGPVREAEVKWHLLREDHFFQPEVSGWWDWYDYDLREERLSRPQADVFTEGEGVTAADGRMTVKLAADLQDSPISQVFTLDAEVVDLDNQAVAGRTSVVVHKSGVYVGLSPERYVVEAGDEAAVNVLVLDHAGIPVPDTEVSATIFERTWYSVREKREDGRFYWTSSYTDTLVAERTVTSDDKGRAVATFVPANSGVHRLVATAEDGDGREARSATYQWVTERGGPFVNWRQENNDRIELVPDKKEYRPGETASILVPAPFSDATALLTIERGGVRQTRVLSLPTNSETVAVPITDDMAPNVFVSVMLVKGVGDESPVPQMKAGYTNIAVSSEGRLIDLEITPDQEVYGPRDTASWNVEARDADGRPVEAELSVALVDRALLSLASDPSTPLTEAFYGQRPLAVETGASLTVSIERLNEQLEADRKGGGGGMTAQEDTVRRQFEDTAFWLGDLRTDAEGQASFETRLPDNLTTWRLDARGVTADTLVGSARRDILATKPVLIRPVAPRFVVLGDNVVLEAVINNGADEEVTVDVTLQAAGLEILDDPTHQVSIPAGGKAEVKWQTTVATDAAALSSTAIIDAVGEVVVGMAIMGDDYEDAVELRLPAYVFHAPETVATAGEVTDRIVETLSIPPAAVSPRRELSVALEPSLAAASLAGLRNLEEAPYDSTEQIISRFVPNIATLTALEDLGLERQELADELRANVATALQSIYGQQLGDGGWGWWSGSTDSSAWLTAYALMGITLAEERDFVVRQDVIESAQMRLVSVLDRTPSDVDEDADIRAFIAYVLSERNNLAPSRAVRLWERRAELGTEGRAFLALALANAGPEQRPRVDGLLAEIGAEAELSATTARWTLKRADRRAFSSDTRMTAVVLYTVARLAPDDPHLERGVRWLMNVREGNGWRTTHETAWSILALAEFMRVTGELEPAYDYTVELNGVELSSGEIAASTVQEPIAIDAGDDLVAGQDNELLLVRRGRGRLYYTARLTTYPSASSAEAVGAGIVIGREYRLADPSTLQAEGDAIDTVKIGDIVEVRLTIVAPDDRYYVKIEDPLPAGLEAMDTTLRTTTVAAAGPELVMVDEQEQETLPWWRRSWWSYWTRSELRDNKVVLFADQLPRGTYEYSYLARASLAGDFHVLPSHVEETYFPEVFGRSAGGIFTVKVD